MNWLRKLFQNVEDFIHSPKLIAVEKEIMALLPFALSIVQDIDALAPNRTLEEINKVATKYGVPTLTAIAADPNATGNALLNLGTSILQANHAPTAATSLLNTVVQLAVVASKTQAS